MPSPGCGGKRCRQTEGKARAKSREGELDINWGLPGHETKGRGGTEIPSCQDSRTHTLAWLAK